MRLDAFNLARGKAGMQQALSALPSWGVGLFLLEMGLMTDGIRLAAGSALHRILARFTKTRLRGLACGVLGDKITQEERNP